MARSANHRILVIDDNRAIHTDFRRVLTPVDDHYDEAADEFFGNATPRRSRPAFEIDSAYQGAEGVAALSRAVEERRPYAVAFVDVQMPPGMDGVEAIEHLWRLDPDLQVVICTAHCDYSWEDLIDRLGHSDRLLVLKKPFDPIEPLQLACALCEKWKLVREAQDRLVDTERIVDERTRDLRASNERLEAEILQRKDAESQLLRAQRLESIGTLASGIAHDLNNMLGPILMSAELLRLESTEENAELLSMIETSAERAAQVVKQVLTFARGLEGERLPLAPKLLIREIEKIVAETFPRVIVLESCVPGDLNLIEGDPTQLHQVLLNLCVNARDAMPAGGALRIEADNFAVDEPHAAMTPGARPGHYVRIRVSDTGTGIPRHLVEKIFDPFFTTKPLGAGTGLGLSTTLGIVRAHQGFIDLTSEPGKGTTFGIFLPAARETAPVLASARAAPAPKGHGELILVVDDESAIRKVTESVLNQNGYRTLSAANGAEAIALFSHELHHIDAVFTDLVMPVVDGVTLCRVLQKMDPEVRILAVTGHGDEGDLKALHSLGIEIILQKPFNSDSLLSAIHQILPRR
jgi:signal transduction histidine kinase